LTNKFYVQTELHENHFFATKLNWKGRLHCGKFHKSTKVLNINEGQKVFKNEKKNV
jgi:hypothetical protein